MILKYATGKLPVKKDYRNLLYKNYSENVVLPNTPDSEFWQTKVGTNWGMMLNDRIGDCPIAGVGHTIMNWTANASTMVTMPDRNILSVYKAISGYNGTPDTDTGCCLLDVLKYWKNTGVPTSYTTSKSTFWDSLLFWRKKHSVSNLDTISAFVQLDAGNIEHAKESVYLFGSAYIGLSLPNAFNDNAKVWDVPSTGVNGNWSPNPNNGHCVIIVGYDSKYLYIVSWGMLIPMTYAFYKAYNDESYGILSKDWFREDKLSPSGFNTQQLQANLILL
jgi:hypothetical protein